MQEVVPKLRRWILERVIRPIKWLMSAYQPLTPDEIFTALLYKEDAGIRDIETPLKVCHNLIVLDKG